MAKAAIPADVREAVEGIVKKFNRSVLRERAVFQARFRGRFVYLDREIGGSFTPICRLAYNGEMDNWDFAIYKYSSDRYDAEEWFFPGAEHVNGTVVGAMRAGMAAYS